MPLVHLRPLTRLLFRPTVPFRSHLFARSNAMAVQTLIPIAILALAFVAVPVTGKTKPVYQISLEKFEPFSSTGKDYVDPGTLRIVRKGRNVFAISGNFTLFKNMGNEVICRSTVSRKASSGKFMKVMSTNAPLCEQIQKDDKYYPILARSSNLVMPAPCPYPKGDYYINNFKVDEEFLPTLLPLGDYQVEVQLVLEEQVVFGYNMLATIS